MHSEHKHNNECTGGMHACLITSNIQIDPGKSWINCNVNELTTPNSQYQICIYYLVLESCIIQISIVVTQISLTEREI